jgi:hypothetical protein
MDQGKTVKIFESKLEKSRWGRPRFKWLEDEEKALGEMMVKKWRQNAVDKEEYANVIKKTKAL